MLLTVVAADGDQKPADICESSVERPTQMADEARDDSDGRNTCLLYTSPSPRD